MEKFNLEQIMAREQNQMQNELEEINREYALLEEKYNKQRKEYDHLEGYAIEKDELAKKYEEENVELQERLKIADESLS